MVGGGEVSSERERFLSVGLHVDRQSEALLLGGRDVVALSLAVLDNRSTEAPAA